MKIGLKIHSTEHNSRTIELVVKLEGEFDEIEHTKVHQVVTDAGIVLYERVLRCDGHIKCSVEEPGNEGTNTETSF